MTEKKEEKKPSPATIARDIFFGRKDGQGPVEIVYMRSMDAYVIRSSQGHHRLYDFTDDSLGRWIWGYIVQNYGYSPRSTEVRETMQQLKYVAPKERIITKIDKDFIAFSDADALDLAVTPPTRIRSHEKDILSPAIRIFPFPLSSLTNSDCPNFKAFLSQIIVTGDGTTTDPLLIAAVQEMFGYCLLTSMPATTAFFLVGEGANGKSVLTKTLRALVGESFAAAMTLETLTMNRFATSSLVGKFVNISDEEESKYMKSDKFKALVSGDTMTAERKFGGAFEFSPQAKLIFATNEMPTFDGVNYGIRRRVKIIPFHRTIPEGERDPNIERTFLPDELPGIMNWALEGLARLRANRFQFTVSETSMNAMKNFEEESSSVVSFVNETYDLTQRGIDMTNAEIYADYKTWCADNGKKPLALRNMFKDANRMFPELKDKFFTKRINGVYSRGYTLHRLSQNPPLTDISF